MRKNLFLLFALCVSFISVAQSNETPYLTKSLSNAGIKNIEVETSGGSISISGVSSADQEIEVYISGNNGNKDLSKEEIQKRLEEDYILDINVNNNKVTAIAKPRRNNMNWKRSLNISFKLYVPQNVSTDLRTSGGSISLMDISGNQDFKTSGGSLNIKNVGGKIDGKTSGGSINVSDSKDELKLATSGGSINAKNCQGTLRLATSGGSLNLDGLKGDIEANTSGGNVHGSNIEGELSTHTSGGSINLSELACNLETSTSGGSVNVEMTSLNKFVKISNNGGDIKLKLPSDKGIDLDLSARKIDAGVLKNFDGKTESDRIEGKLNGGGTEVEVRSGSGRISLSFN
jgi:hypothetical protein